MDPATDGELEPLIVLGDGQLLLVTARKPDSHTDEWTYTWIAIVTSTSSRSKYQSGLEGGGGGGGVKIAL